MSDTEPRPARKTTSTLLDGRHVFPPFYACYLLRSKATTNSNRTYVSEYPMLDRMSVDNGRVFRSDLHLTLQEESDSTMASSSKGHGGRLDSGLGQVVTYPCLAKRLMWI